MSPNIQCFFNASDIRVMLYAGVCELFSTLRNIEYLEANMSRLSEKETHFIKPFYMFEHP